jgi:hypothetical protein
MDEQITSAVHKFLDWELPHDFVPDGGILYYSSWGKGKLKGSNLFSERQAKEMFTHCLSNV